jgi:hypothetical protein
MENAMKDPQDKPVANPMNHPEEQPVGGDGTPKFGRLLIVLILVVVLTGVITYLSEALYS